MEWRAVAVDFSDRWSRPTQFTWKRNNNFCFFRVKRKERKKRKRRPRRLQVTSSRPCRVSNDKRRNTEENTNIMRRTDRLTMREENLRRVAQVCAPRYWVVWLVDSRRNKRPTENEDTKKGRPMIHCVRRYFVLPQTPRLRFQWKSRSAILLRPSAPGLTLLFRLASRKAWEQRRLWKQNKI